MVFRSKLRVSVEDDRSISAADIAYAINNNYSLTYCGKHYMNNKCYVYLQNKSKMSPNIIHRLVSTLLVVKEIGPYESLMGTVEDPFGGFRRPGEKKASDNKKRTVVNNTSINNGTINNTTNITNNNNNNNIQYINININPVGQESIAHITPEFIQNLLSHVRDKNVVFAFGEELYSNVENINFQGDVSKGYFRGVEASSSGGKEWTTLSTDRGLEVIYNNLLFKNEEAVEKCKGSIEIPQDDLVTFGINIQDLREDQVSNWEENEIRHKKFRNKGIKPLMDNARSRFKKFKKDHKSSGNQLVTDV
jgi:hypothetical protein